jgi:hypothetical protein
LRLALTAVILVSLPGAAQADPKFGVRLGYYTKVILKSDSEFVIGAGLRF